MTIAIRLAASNPKGARYTSANLTRANGFIGVDGAVRFTARGTPQRGLAVLEVGKFGQNNGVKVVGTEKKPSRQGPKEIELPGYRGQGGIFGDFFMAGAHIIGPFLPVSAVSFVAGLAFFIIGYPLWDLVSTSVHEVNRFGLWEVSCFQCDASI